MFRPVMAIIRFLQRLRRVYISVWGRVDVQISMHPRGDWCIDISSWIRPHTDIQCPERNVPYFGRMFLKLKYTDITKNTYIRSWTVTEIMTREKCGLLAVLRNVPGSRDVLLVHCACPSFSLHSAQARSCWDCTCKVLGTLRTTMTLVRVLM